MSAEADKISLNLSLAHAQDSSTSYQKAPPLQTIANDVTSVMNAGGAAYDAGMHTSQLQLQPQPSVGVPLSLQTFSNGVAPAIKGAAKRKRGRPRKYNPSADMPLATVPAPCPAGIPSGVGLVSPQAPPAVPLLLLPPPPSANATQRAKKRRLQAPRSTTNKQKVTMAGPGVIGLNPQVITVQVGEDIATKLMSFSGNGWAVSILSAHGVVSNVTLCQGASFRETAIYEGCFEILSLAGSYQPSETNGMSNRTGGLSVSLADLGGRVFGGRVAGALTAASPVQVVIGRFPVEEKKKLKRTGVPDARSSTAREI